MDTVRLLYQATPDDAPQPTVPTIVGGYNVGVHCKTPECGALNALFAAAHPPRKAIEFDCDPREAGIPVRCSACGEVQRYAPEEVKELYLPSEPKKRVSLPAPKPLKGRDATVQMANPGTSPWGWYPDVSAAAMGALGSWSEVERFLLEIYVRLAGGSKGDAAAIYLSLEGDGPKNTVLNTVAKRKLTVEQLRLLSAILRLVKTASKTRNKLAHWCWGASPEITNGLLIADPKVVVVAHSNAEDWATFTSHIYIYTKEDFAQIERYNTHLAWLLLRFWSFLYNRERMRDIFDELCRDPEIAEILDRPERLTQTPQSESPQQPPASFPPPPRPAGE